MTSVKDIFLNYFKETSFAMVGFAWKEGGQPFPTPFCSTQRGQQRHLKRPTLDQIIRL